MRLRRGRLGRERLAGPRGCSPHRKGLIAARQRCATPKLASCSDKAQRAVMAKPILLTVDDDPDVLRAIERDLRSQYGAEYRVIGSDSPQGALTLRSEERR